MLLIFSIIIAMGLSKMMGRFLKSPVFSKLHQPVESTQHLNLKVKRLNKPVLPYLYIFGMILSQGKLITIIEEEKYVKVISF